jgi:hypothetical protein
MKMETKAVRKRNSPTQFDWRMSNIASQDYRPNRLIGPSQVVTPLREE